MPEYRMLARSSGHSMLAVRVTSTSVARRKMVERQTNAGNYAAAGVIKAVVTSVCKRWAEGGRTRMQSCEGVRSSVREVRTHWGQRTGLPTGSSSW